MKKLLFATLLLFGCSFVGGSSLNPEVQLTLINLSNRYLMAVSNGDVRQAGSYILWPEYLRHRRGIQSKDIIMEAIVRTPSVIPADASSKLRSLRVKSVRGRDNTARVILEKEGVDEIEIEYVWNGSGWMISDDSLFGPGRMITELLEEQDKKLAANSEAKD